MGPHYEPNMSSTSNLADRLCCYACCSVDGEFHQVLGLKLKLGPFLDAACQLGNKLSLCLCRGNANLMIKPKLIACDLISGGSTVGSSDFGAIGNLI